MKKKLFAFVALLLCASFSRVAAENVILTTPQYYYILNISHNGKWACGYYSDYSYTNYGFLWNLETDEKVLLSTVYPSIGWSVSNDGVVGGSFTDVLDNGVTVNMPGYWKEGRWYAVELPEGAVDGEGYGISDDGHYLSGDVCVNGVDGPMIWKDGEIYRNMIDGAFGRPYCISPDGQSAAGWSYPYAGANRCSAYWRPDGTKVFLNDRQDMFCAASKFSPDGKKILFWGGWRDNDDDDFDDDVWPVLPCIYDVETGEVDSIYVLNKYEGLVPYDMSSNNIVVASTEADEKGEARIYADGQLYTAYDYLTAKGFNFDDVDIAKRDDVPYFWRATGISADGSCIALCYFDGSEGQARSMVVMLDRETGTVAPVDVAAEQMQDINTVCVTWKKSLLASDVQGYNVYRNGTKVNTDLLTGMKYYDNVPAADTYTYTVAAVYDDKEVQSESVNVAVTAKAVSKPQGVFTRQRGVSGAQMQWLAPATNYISRTYADMENLNAQGFGANQAISFEIGIGFDKDDIANYAGNKISKVVFYPMAADATGWKLNIYTHTADGALSRLVSKNITQPLNYSEFNTVELDTPLDLPDSDLIVAIETSVSDANMSIVGHDFGHCTSGYSDLIRKTSEADFYSLSKASEAVPYYTSWLISMVLEPENASVDADKVDHYTIYADGDVVGETADQSYSISTLADGGHTLGVSATFADGRTSEVSSAGLTIATTPKAVDNIYMSLNGKTEVEAWWDTPTDDDDRFLSYASGEASSSRLIGPAENNYGLMASVVYPPDMLKGYNGYYIYSFRFYPTADALFTFYLYKNDVLVSEVEVEDYVLGKWNMVYLPAALPVDEKAEYRLVLDCYDVTPEMAPLAFDKNAARTFYSDAYSLDGESWYSASDTNVHGNWMLGWKMLSLSGEPIAVDGYDVRIDDVKKNETMLTEPKFTYDFGTDDGETHCISVDVHYPSLTESVKGNASYFILSRFVGIDDTTIEKLSLRLGDNYLRVEGEGVQSVAAYNLAGVKAAAAQGNTLNITSLQPGVYVIKAKAADGELVRKIEISK